MTTKDEAGTLVDRNALAQQLPKWEEVAREIVRKRAVLGSLLNPREKQAWPSSEVHASISEDGLILYEITEPQWESSGWDIRPIIVRWDDIDHSDMLLRALNTNIGVAQRRQSRQEKKVRREAYMRLKAEFEKPPKAGA